MKLACIALVAGLFVCAPPFANATDLSELSLEELLKVSIIGASKYEQKQSEVAAAASVITRKEIKAFGWRTLDEALASLPGMYTSYDRQYTSLGTRGFGVPGDFNTRILLTIDGNRVNDVVFDAALMGRAFPVDVSLIERIEFIPGPGGAVYGQNALLGVVNVVTRSGRGVNGTELSAAYQSPQMAGHGRVTWGKQLDSGLDVLLSASSYRAKGEDRFFVFPGAGPGGTDIAGDARGMDSEKARKFFARMDFGRWSFDFSYGDRRKDDPTGNYFTDPLVPGQYQRDRHLLTQLQYQDSFAGNTLHFSGRIFNGRERFTSLFSVEAPLFSTASSDWYGGELRLLSTRWAKHKLMFGLEHQANTRHDQTLEDLAARMSDVVIPGSSSRQGVYAQDEWAISQSLTATLGLRVDRNNVTGTKRSPRAGLIWQATPATNIKALYGRAHRAPNALERDYDDGISQAANHKLNGETIDTLELVLDHRMTPSLSLRGSLYQWKMVGLVVLGMDPVSDLAQYQSGEEVKSTGVELSADKTWEWGGRLRGSLTYQNTQYGNGTDLPNSPHAMGKLNFSGPLAATGLFMGYEFQYFSKRETILKGTHTGGYALSNLNLMTGKWFERMEVSLGVYNLFDKHYVQPGADTNWQNALEQDGRQVRLKAVYAF